MRIRKLSQELGVTPEDLISLAAELNLGNYHDSEQQLGKDAENHLRVAVRKRPTGVPRATSLRSEFMPQRPPVRPAIADDPLWADMMRGVIAPQPTPKAAAPRVILKVPQAAPAKAAAPVAPPVTKAAPVAPPATKAAPVAKAVPAAVAKAMPAAKVAAVAKVVPVEVPAPAPPPAPVPAPDLALKAEIEALQKKVQELEAKNSAISADALALGVQLARLLGTEERQSRELDGLRFSLASAQTEATTLKARLGTLEGQSRVELRRILEQRGLIGDDEAAAALKALLEARFYKELSEMLCTEDPERFRELLHDRLVLAAEGDEIPAGAVVVRVPAERSEAAPPSMVQQALRRFSTACLIQGIKSIVIVGGSPPYHRQLREGLDGRLRLRLIPGDRRGQLVEYPSADLVLLWVSTILDHRVSAHYPKGVVIPHRGIARMLMAAADHIEGR